MASGFLDPFEWPDAEPDYHAAYSIQLCELVNDGFDPFGDPRWATLAWPDADTQTRIETLLQARYWYREIGIMPPGEWRHELTRVMGETLLRYAPLYAAVASGVDPLSTGDEYHKERHVYSDFPATQLDTSTEDYARNAEDFEWETLRQGDYLEKLGTLARDYRSPDVLVLDAMEPLFSFMQTVSINGL